MDNSIFFYFYYNSCKYNKKFFYIYNLIYILLKIIYLINF